MSVAAVAEQVLPREFEPDAAVSSPPWLQARRVQALKRFHASGIPHRRIEEWKYSDLRNALESPHEAASEMSVASADAFAAIAGARLVIRNGRLETAPPPSGAELFDLATLTDDAPDWVKRNLGEVLSRRTMGEASLALMRGGVALRIAHETTAPLHLRFQQSTDSAHARVLIVVEDGAALTLLESHDRCRGLVNLGVEIVLEPGARLTHIRLADAAPECIAVEEIAVRLARDAHYRGHFSQAGAKLSRVELAIALEGHGAEAELSGATVIGDKRHADVTTHIDHVVGKTTSRQLFKHVVGGHAHAAYQGKISVRKGADGSDSRQTAKALLLGARAEADLKPELEILADDVKCAHGAAVGDLDADSLFYLRSRGIPEDEARQLLIQAFLEETVDEIAEDDIRKSVWHFLECGLANAVQP
jgi:Fe-S cluster assembly protein SufD